MRTIFLIMIGFSMLWSQGVGIVHDSKTGLDWQDDYSSNGDNIKYSNWTEAIDYCEAFSLGGYDDWRLPNINELKSIKSNLGIRLGFNNVVPILNNIPEDYTDKDYWSSTSYVKFNNSAWVMGFGYDLYSFKNKNFNHYVRCVREGQ